MNITLSPADRTSILSCIARFVGVSLLARSLKTSRAIRLVGALVATATLSSCGFSIRLPWFQACRDIEQIEPTEANTPPPSTVFEELGSIKVMEGVTRAVSVAGRLLRVEQSVEIPAYANQATVILNGWQAAYNDSDHHLYDVAAILGRIKVIPGQQISWNAIGDLADYDGDETFTWTYRYTIIAWNDANVRAMVDHNDAEQFCKSGEADGDDNFFQGKNTNENATTALQSFPSFLRNGGFASGRQVAVLPRGFVFSWDGPGGGDDHHLLQLAYNLESVAPFVRGQDYHKASLVVNPLANAAAEKANGEFVSWKTSVIMKDNSLRRDYSFVEFVSGMGGADVEIIQPEFSILPREDVDSNFPGGGTRAGLKSLDVVIENLPYLCAVPILTGWEIGYTPPGEGDQHVKELGILIDLLRYERAPGSPTGTLRYRVSSIVKDNDEFPDNFFRHKVTILGIKPTGVIVPPAPPAPTVQ
jgi:hypothetical protein